MLQEAWADILFFKLKSMTRSQTFMEGHLMGKGIQKQA